jgi:hypothetical protein
LDFAVQALAGLPQVFERFSLELKPEEILDGIE